jgi:signal transduction histidine kinase
VYRESSMERRHTKSISTRLTIMNMLVSGVALLLACAGLFAYDQITFRESLVRTLSAQAQIIASNSVSAILFNDPQAAANTLAALKSSQSIVSAGIFTNERRPLAQYVREPGDDLLSVPPLSPGDTEAHWFRAKDLILVRQITSEGKSIGFVYLRAGLHELDDRLKRYALISAVVLLLSLLAALLVSSAFRKSVAQPITQLAATAREISIHKDYATRVTPSTDNDEIAVLIDSFNKMLAELLKAHDESEQRVADRTRELVSANRELEAFSYSVSHDLRGPLDAINGLSYLLLDHFGDRLDQETRELVANIRGNGKRMVELIDDLLNLSRVSGTVMRKEKVDLSEIARSILQELSRTAPDRKVEFIIPSKLEVYGDAHLIRIAIENLLRNAWKYTSHHDRATIEIGSHQKHGETLYFVRDDGAGFDIRSADRLFQPFQRFHSKADFPGNGIGLATVRRIIQRHGGEIWAEAAVEKGATFYFTLGSSRVGGAGTRDVVDEKAEV